MKNGIGQEHPYQQKKDGEEPGGTTSRTPFSILEEAIGDIPTEMRNISHFIKRLHERLSNLIDGIDSTRPDSSCISRWDRLMCFEHEVKEMLPIIDVLNGYSQNCAKEANELWKTLDNLYGSNT
jgi:hypothetical protein